MIKLMKPPQRQKQRYPHFINNYIRANIVRVIYDNINATMPLNQAIEMAYNLDMDLVQMNTEEVAIPTCKIMKYSKYLFELKRKKQLEAKNNKNILKEMTFRPFIAKNDLEIKFKQIKDFLTKGSEVRLKMQLNKKERDNAQEYYKLLETFAAQFSTTAKAQIGPAGILLLKPLKTSAKTSKDEEQVES